MKLTNSMVKELKKDFPIFKNNLGLVYLDSAATSQKPQQILDAVNDFIEKDNANVSRGVYTLAEKATERYAKAREKMASFIGAEENEIIFTKNATEGLNLVAYKIDSLIPEGKDEILVTEMEHHSNFVPWQQLAKRLGFKFKVVKITKNFTLDMDDLKEKLSEKTALFAFTHVSNVLGAVNDVGLLASLAKEKGALSVVDAAQSVQHLPISVKDIDCDFLAFSSHKILGPNGIGVLYGKSELLKKMKPFNYGGGMINKVTFEETEFAEPPQRFEAGTQNIAEAVGLTAAIDYLEKIGLENIFDWEKELTDYALEKLNSLEGVEVYHPKDGNSVGVISFTLDSIHPHDVASVLNDYGICIRAGHHCAMPLMKSLGVGGTCRASFYLYNTMEDVDALVEGIKRVLERFG